MREQEEQLGEVIPRMTDEHWNALAYVEKYGLAPAPSDAYDDLLEWELVYDTEGNGIVMTTDLGDLVLDEEP